MDNSGQGGDPSGDAAKVTITVNSNTGALNITKDNNCTEKSETGNPIAGWNKTKYTPRSGRFNITVEGTKAASKLTDAGKIKKALTNIKTALSTAKTDTDTAAQADREKTKEWIQTLINEFTE